MLVYLITFMTSYLFCLFGEKEIKKGHQKKAKSILFLSVFIVSIMAGLRNNNVGSDTISYTTYYIEYGSGFQTLKEFMGFFSVYEPGFNFFSYIVGRIFNHSSHWFLFWCAMVIYGFAMRAFYYYRNNCSLSMAWLFFLMINCTEALNITRHYMALSLAAYAFTFTFKKDFKKFTFWTVLAMSFHVSAAFNFILYFIYRGLYKFNTWWYKVLIVFGTAIASFMHPYLFQILSVFSFIETKVASYLNFTEFNIQINPILIRMPFLLLFVFHRRSFCSMHLIDDKGECNKHDVFGEFCFLVLIIELILSQLRGFSETLYRMVTYEAVLKYVSYSKVIDMSPYILNRTAKKVMAYSFMTVIFMYWVVYLNSGLIYPYVSDVLDIMK